MFAAMHAAKTRIDLEYYIFEDVESEGEHLSDLLLEKRRDGVAVDIIYDSYGSIDTPASFIDRMKEAGVVFLEFHPVNPLKAQGSYAPNERGAARRRCPADAPSEKRFRPLSGGRAIGLRSAS